MGGNDARDENKQQHFTIRSLPLRQLMTGITTSSKVWHTVIDVLAKCWCEAREERKTDESSKQTGFLSYMHAFIQKVGTAIKMSLLNRCPAISWEAVCVMLNSQQAKRRLCGRAKASLIFVSDPNQFTEYRLNVMAEYERIASGALGVVARRKARCRG